MCIFKVTDITNNSTKGKSKEKHSTKLNPSNKTRRASKSGTDANYTSVTNPTSSSSYHAAPFSNIQSDELTKFRTPNS